MKVIVAFDLTVILDEKVFPFTILAHRSEPLNDIEVAIGEKHMVREDQQVLIRTPDQAIAPRNAKVDLIKGKTVNILIQDVVLE